MLIHCKYCESKFAIDAEEVGFDGRLIKCNNCDKEWFQESKAQIVEKKLIELDRNLHVTELHLIEKKNSHNNKIIKLEKALKTKKEELEKQKKLEDRINLFEKRIIDMEREIESQNLVENRISRLEKEIQKNSFDSFVKNTKLEKKTNELQNKIYAEDIEDRLEDLEKLEKEVKDKTAEVSNNDISLEKKANELKEKILSYNTNDKLEDLEQQVIQTKNENNIIDNQKDDEITDNDKLNDLKQQVIQTKNENNIIDNQKDDEITDNDKLKKYSFFSPISEKKINVDRNKKSSKSFFWSKKEKNTPNKKVNINNIYNPKNWDLREEAIESELEQIKKSKKKP